MVNPSIVLLHLKRDNSLQIKEYILNISTTNDIYHNLSPLLRPCPDYVFIESQTPKNIQCYKISYMLEMFFKCELNINVIFTEPISKNQHLQTRKERKQFSMNLAERRLNKLGVEWGNFTHDFADAFNMGMDKLSEITRNKKKLIEINNILSEMLKKSK